MSALVIVDVSVQDRPEYEQYKKLTPASIAAFDGKFLVRGGTVTPLEGAWNPERIVVLEFPTVERANSWWHSEMYAVAKAIRHKAAKTKMIIVESL